MAVPKKRIGEMLLEAGIIDETQLKAALGHQRQWGVRLGQALVDLKLATEADIVRALSLKFGFEVAKIDALEPYGHEQALKLFPREFTTRNNVFPMWADTANVTVAMSDPTNLAVVDEIRFRTGRRVKVCIGGDHEVAEAVRRHFPAEGDVQAIALDLEGDPGIVGEAVFDPFGGGSTDALESFFGGGPEELRHESAAAAAAPAAPAAPPQPHPARPAVAPSRTAIPAPAAPAARAPPQSAPPRTGTAIPAQGAPAPARTGTGIPAQGAPVPSRTGTAIPAQGAPVPSRTGTAIPAQGAPAPARTGTGIPAQGAPVPSRTGTGIPAHAAPQPAPSRTGTGLPAQAAQAARAAPQPSPARAAPQPAPSRTGTGTPAQAAPRPAAPAPSRPAPLELEEGSGGRVVQGVELTPIDDGGEPLLATDLAPAAPGRDGPERELTAQELAILESLDRLASGAPAQPDIVKPAQAMAALIRLLIRKRLVTELEFLDELSKK